ncbi:hypothetical protein OsI_31947 [Oryza sativa Indica Group]|uniref:Uncharacterized protein n=1 Tax=Oryza sativa subsp. indica TaxID=39946 RepID=B8BDA8_ORYSI|nr:hypothetical protein OsI_31947 [Oryza sativa Indica Group]
MAELLVRPLLSAVTNKASSYLVDQYKVMEGMEQQRKALERMLPLILSVIQDAEEKRSKKPELSAWLNELKKVSYEATDVFDEFKYEALRREAKKKGHDPTLDKGNVSIFPSRNPIVFRYRMGKKLQTIVQKIKILVSEMDSFGLIKLQQEVPRQWRQTDSIMVDTEKDIVSRSRDEEKKKIIKMLLEGKDLRILPIVGMGGIGKTTFAQLIYNDPEIEKHFQLRRWCCVSDVFDIVTIANSICMSTERDREKALQDLQKEVGGKKYLIVLDDVWNRDSDKWGKLMTCLKKGDMGSVVLTTTRDAEVARIMVTGEVQVHNLEKLGEDYLMEIIQGKAFSLLESDEHFEVLRKIVQRCDGSPLAAKSFGSVLYNRSTVQEWKVVLAKSNICNEEENKIFPILRLSYDDLPLHIKQCFAFCAIFPKDYEIRVENLIQLWLAHDFIPLQEDDNLEMVAEDIFKELVWRSFFQDVKKFPLRTTCKIHDLMHDIAQSVIGKECVSIASRSDFKSMLLKHPMYHFHSSYIKTVLLDDFMKKQSPTLRTILFEECFSDISTSHLSKSSSLRALSLNQSIKLLPIRARYLQHLRYLDISQNDCMKELPEDICILYNLQTLNLSNCHFLVTLPKDMKYMTSLRHLYTNGCLNLKCMPPELGQLTSLRTLTDFVVGDSSGCSTLRELQNLNLCGELQLRGLENVSQEDAKAVNLIKKEKLTHLSLVWDSKCRVEEPNCHEKVLDALKPHHGPLMLTVISYKSTHFPAWMKDLKMLQNLVELKLDGCTMCEEFPPFIQCKSLQVLYLIRLDKLQTLCCEEGRQGKEEAFHLLKKVVIESCPKFRTLVHDMASTTFPAQKKINLHELDLDRLVAIGGQENGPTFPLLEEIVIEKCPKLQTLCYEMASTAFPSLKKIRLYDLGGLERLVENKSTLSLLEVVDIRNCPKLRSLPEAPKLKIFTLNENKAQLSLFLLQSRCMSSLSKLILDVDDQKRTVQLGQIHESSLSKLEFRHCNFFYPTSPSQPIIIFWKRLGQLVHLRISNCDALIYWPEEEFRCLVSLKTLEIMQCDKLIRRPMLVKEEPTCCARDQLLPRLTSLSIRACDSLRELFVLPPSLTNIDISLCSNLEYIWGMGGIESESAQVEHHHTFTSSEHCNDWACGSVPEQSPSAADHPLPCLESLSVASCPKMVALENLPSSLKKLYIYSCPEIHSVLGQLSALDVLYIHGCHKLESLNRLGDLSSLETLDLRRCKCLASLPCGLGSYSSLSRITIRYCPTLNKKPLYKHLRARSDSLEERDLSHARARDPYEGTSPLLFFFFFRFCFSLHITDPYVALYALENLITGPSVLKLISIVKLRY